MQIKSNFLFIYRLSGGNIWTEVTVMTIKKKSLWLQGSFQTTGTGQIGVERTLAINMSSSGPVLDNTLNTLSSQLITDVSACAVLGQIRNVAHAPW